MVTLTPENFEATRRHGFKTLGVKTRHRRKAERMVPGDRVLYFLTGVRAFPAIATVASSFFEDHRPIWVNDDRRPDSYPWRVNIRPDMVLERDDWLDAYQIAPRLLYVKRWPPELWPLAFQGSVHLLSSQDFRLIEREMERVLEMRGQRRDRPRRHFGRRSNERRSLQDGASPVVDSQLAGPAPEEPSPWQGTTATQP
jgi:hypothetical protein